jgi:hypothetical protein
LKLLSSAKDYAITVTKKNAGIVAAIDDQDAVTKGTKLGQIGWGAKKQRKIRVRMAKERK